MGAFPQFKEIQLIHQSIRLASLTLLAALAVPAMQAIAQEQVPAAPAADAPAPAPATAPVFPPPDPGNFTATTPTKETVNAFININFGYDENRIWQVQAILKTPVDGISKVVVYIADKTGKQKPYALSFFTLPDGKHLIAGEDIMVFSEHPFVENRALIQKEANGPYRGAVSKDLELVEFADFQCPHCKDAQANLDKLVADFPKAHVVFQNFPLNQHPAAAGAAAYGVCVSKIGGSDAFFTFATAVFEGQDGLKTPDGATLTLNAAAVKAGLDPVKVEACSKTPEAKAAVDASVKLAKDLNVNQTPTLIVNGRSLPFSGIPYETIKQIIQFQANLDGVK